MELKNRLKFITGIFFVLLLVGALILYLNTAMSTLRTSRSQLKSDSITVGTDYPGLITKQFVDEGDKVIKGQKLFLVNSQQLLQDISSGRINPASLPFVIDNDNNMVVAAKEDGVVREVFYRTGAYAPVGSILANIDTVESLYVEAHYDLSPPYYARLHKGDTMVVTLPDNTKINAIVYNISLVSRGETVESVDTVIKARLQGADLSDFRFGVGTPVGASLKLTNETWYQGVVDFTKNLLKPKAN